jgi:protein-S-isoprenylcysteine O-methyltransferase Ste14
LIKAGDEEAHLEKLYGAEYRDYKRRSGSLLPILRF